MKKRLIATTLMVTFILSAGAQSFADALGGPRSGKYRISARDTQRFNVFFVAGRTARVAVVGDGYTILDLYIYDLNGNLIAKDERSTVALLVEWQPRFGQTFIIEVVNRGNTYNEYGVATN